MKVYIAFCIWCIGVFVCGLIKKDTNKQIDKWCEEMRKTEREKHE